MTTNFMTHCYLCGCDMVPVYVKGVPTFKPHARACIELRRLATIDLELANINAIRSSKYNLLRWRLKRVGIGESWNGPWFIDRLKPKDPP